MNKTKNIYQKWQYKVPHSKNRLLFNSWRKKNNTNIWYTCGGAFQNQYKETVSF